MLYLETPGGVGFSSTQEGTVYDDNSVRPTQLLPNNHEVYFRQPC